MSTETQIIPQLAFPKPLEEALAQADQFGAELAPLREQAKTEITDTASYQAIGLVLTQERAIRKQVKAAFSPFDAIVDRVRDFLRTSRQKQENLCEEIDGLCVSKMKTWERLEREAAAKEEKQLQKKGEQASVAPNLPSVAGYRKTVNYPITIEDPKALIRALLKAYKATNTKRVQFLGQFVMLDEKAIAQHARNTKDVKKFNAEMPGITCKEA